MDDYISKPVNPDKLHDVLSRRLLGQDIGQSGEEKSGSKSSKPLIPDAESIVDVAHLELFTEGDLDQEQIISEAFLRVGEGSLDIMREHVDGKNTDEDWKMAAHKLKGSSAQIGANALSAWCLAAESNFQASIEEKMNMLGAIENDFLRVRKFFQARQTG